MNYCFNFYDQMNVLLRYIAWRSVIGQPRSQGSLLLAPQGEWERTLGTRLVIELLGSI